MCCSSLQAKFTWGARGPEFKSRRSDQYLRAICNPTVSAFVSTFGFAPRRSTSARSHPNERGSIMGKNQFTRATAAVDTREEQLALAGHLMRQAAQAAILLVEEDEQPQIAADLLRLARDRWD